MRAYRIGALCLGFAQLALCQNTTALQESLYTSLASYSDLSTFRGLLANYTTLLDFILPNTTGKVTVLIPDNTAFKTFAAANGGDILSVGVPKLVSILKYHFMVSELKGSNFTATGGLTVPTLLEGAEYNNRSASADLINQFGAQANGQVIFASADPINPAKIKVRQANSVALRGGMAEGANLNALDGTWSGGIFHSVNTILTPPANCSTTARDVVNLSALDNALNRTNLWDTLNHAANVTCLAPASSAFLAAGNPDQNLSTGELTNALLFHTLPFPTYSNFLKDGMEITSLANLTVKVTIKDGDIYFNDAKLISPNVLTNNGLIHVLDKVMSPLNATSTSTATPTATSTSTSTSSPTPTKNAGSQLGGENAPAGLLAFAVAAAVLI